MNLDFLMRLCCLGVIQVYWRDSWRVHVVLLLVYCWRVLRCRPAACRRLLLRSHQLAWLSARNPPACCISENHKSSRASWSLMALACFIARLDLTAHNEHFAKCYNSLCMQASSTNYKNTGCYIFYASQIIFVLSISQFFLNKLWVRTSVEKIIAAQFILN